MTTPNAEADTKAAGHSASRIDDLEKRLDDLEKRVTKLEGK